MSQSLPANLPPRNILAQSTQRYISLLKTQLSIAYPTENLEHSSQLDRDPVLKLVVGLIIVISKRSCPSEEDCSQLLDEWLHFGLYELPLLHDCKEMVRDRSFLERLYQGGIVNFFPPVLALEELKEDYMS
ncbi:putative polyketide synthase protein [Corchorus olitorius]|uniref:Polyketide synthase protein n=1 Tax=Corchorus olitorius TaxID=93759 RepID=A0A1R3G230_9ROSI|nr:putative polyketide synthase protein [Corchorus olitorius]